MSSLQIRRISGSPLQLDLKVFLNLTTYCFGDSSSQSQTYEVIQEGYKGTQENTNGFQACGVWLVTNFSTKWCKWFGYRAHWHLTLMYSECFPLIKVKTSSRDPPFMEPLIKHLCNLRNKSMKRHGFLIDTTLQERINNLIRENQVSGSPQWSL